MNFRIGDMTVNSNGNICLDCGICCDGTFFDFVPVSEVEATVLESTGLSIKLVEGLGLRIQLPCMKFGSCCTIYADRPAICRSFRCRLLKSMDKGDIETGYALQRIQLLKALKAELEQIIPDRKEISYFREVRNYLIENEKSGPERRKENARVLMLGTRFMNLINDDFVYMLKQDNDQSGSEIA
jgi:Fe-S-cluster containining protein